MEIIFLLNPNKMKKLHQKALQFLNLFCLLFACVHVNGQVYRSAVSIDKGEYWWGGAVALGSKMPYLVPVATFDLATQNGNNQVVPLFLSSKGRSVWSDYPFRFEVKKDSIYFQSNYELLGVQQHGKTLKEAYLDASKKHFPPSGTIPDTLFFTMPQYNTWIELMYNQNQKDIMHYAQQIVQNDLPAGILMIDDNWQKYYGNFEFKPDLFPNPEQMIRQLHTMGFKVMLWVCPFVSADCPEYRFLADKGWLLKQKGSKQPAIIPWWNGYSACYDLTNPDAFNYLISQLKEMQEKYGIDGFKFDAGDNAFYDPALVAGYDKNALSVTHTESWEKVGLAFPFNEFRAGWKMGGQPLVERLGDKEYSWNAVKLLVPDMVAAGLLGYAYTCPDMIGGGSFTSFLNISDDKFDQTLIVRSAQVHALMPMMQFSVAPWRILSPQNLAIVRNMARLHEKMGNYILHCARESSHSGEPIVRAMEYAFPNEGFAACNDQFMLGERYLVAPVVTPENSRTVRLPKGKWKDEQGKIHKGGQTIRLTVPLERLPYFEKL